MGDPAGVGPELGVRLLSESSLLAHCRPIVFGDVAVMRAAGEATGIAWNEATQIVNQAADVGGITGPAIYDIGAIEPGAFSPGELSAAAGKAAYTYVEHSIEAVQSGRVDAVTTLPLNKEAMRMAGINFPGHTEIFASRTNTDDFCMMQYSEIITCTFVTVHVGYAEVPALLTRDRILQVIELTADALTRIRKRSPRIVVCGLNPHAGEHGLFGDGEEERAIIPAIEAAREQGINAVGPVPPDTAFIKSSLEANDAFVCMYHDQGHIPVKALAFDSAVNTTLGLPVIRTSVDHGTAFDIAWTGKARPDSLYSAVRLAIDLSREPASASH
ncbi:MAG: 4-hydroxythreonine-4-phosphate dehydrogenase PdxA [Verrucomicrobiae bacterium]|nr:4-hydroxythreonine-4-phosphate dehydrogenase PdxA [Verrucomicrobiae bacterium]